MPKPELSLLMPGIRPERWKDVFESIHEGTKRSFELIIVSPYRLPEELTKYKNIKHVTDWGNPVRASAIGYMLFEADIIYPTLSDDAIVIKDSLDNSISELLEMGDGIKNTVLCKYSEDAGGKSTNYQPDDYYKIVNAYPANPQFVPKDWIIFNSNLWYREYFDYLGGWDTIFQTCPFSHADLAIRAQRDGIKTKISNFPIAQLDHMPGMSGDHAPIHIGHTTRDEPLFAQKYNQPLENFPIVIDKYKWKESDNIWDLRFS